jgi:FolB domain-containing protein
MDKILINDLSAHGIIGVNPDERVRPQEIKINLVLYTNTIPAGKSDDIKDTVNYSQVAKKVKAYAETSNRFTVEALAEDIAQICLEDKRVKKVVVRVEKLAAVRTTRSVGVEIERENTLLSE